MSLFAPLAIVLALALAFGLLILGVKVLFPRVWEGDEKIKNFVEMFALLCAGAWAISMFNYTEFTKPREEQPELSVKASMEEVGRKQGSVAVKVSVSAENTGNRRALIMAAYYNVEALKGVSFKRASDDEYTAAASAELSTRREAGGDTTISRYENYHSRQGDVVHSSNLMQGTELEAGEGYSRDTLFYVSEADYDLLRITFKVYAAPKDSKYADKIFGQWVLDKDQPKNQLRIKFLAKEGADCDEKRWQNCPEFNPNDNPKHKELRMSYALMQFDAISALSLWQAEADKANKPTGEAGR